MVVDLVRSPLWVYEGCVNSVGILWREDVLGAVDAVEVEAVEVETVEVETASGGRKRRSSRRT